METTKVLITDVKLLYPAIYETRRRPGSDLDRHMLGFEVSEEWAKWLTDAGIRIKSKDGVLWANSNNAIAPLVAAQGSNYDPLLKAVALAAARNITLDRVMRGMEADVRVQLYDYDYNGLKGKGLAVVEIIVNADDLLLNVIQCTGE